VRRALAFLVLAWLAIAPPLIQEGLAQEAQLADPQLEQRARDLGREIRCVVCQSQSVADSDADIAQELRVLIREQIAAGKSDQEIRDYLVARYGDFVLFDPPFKGSTYALWLGPFAILVLAGIGVALYFRRSREPARVRELSADEHSRVERLLHDGPEDRA
jgi:cytochrome c-type biogenesis protein CcmH